MPRLVEHVLASAPRHTRIDHVRVAVSSVGFEISQPSPRAPVRTLYGEINPEPRSVRRAGLLTLCVWWGVAVPTPASGVRYSREGSQRDFYFREKREQHIELSRSIELVDGLS